MINLKSPEEIELMAEGGRRLAHVLQVLASEVGVGIVTRRLDSMARELIKQADAKPAFLGYRPAGGGKVYPFSICVSINDVVVHGQPSDYEIKDGDLVKLDLGLEFMGFCVDSALTVGAGKIKREASRLITVTKNALDAAITEAEPGKTVGDIGFAIENFVRKNKFSVVKSLTGHGIGRELHEEPQVLNFGRKGTGDDLEVGMVIAIEPMVAMGSGETEQLKDDSFVTADGSLAAHWEHTVAITKNGPRVLTQI
jgi:methionyl aminopeptidase